MVGVTLISNFMDQSHHLKIRMSNRASLTLNSEVIFQVTIMLIVYIGGDQLNKGSRVLGQGKTDMRGTTDREEVDEYGRVTKGPYTLKNGATYTGQWLEGMRDGYGTQLWPDGSRYEGMWQNDKANG